MLHVFGSLGLLNAMSQADISVCVPPARTLNPISSRVFSILCRWAGKIAGLTSSLYFIVISPWLPSIRASFSGSPERILI